MPQPTEPQTANAQIFPHRAHFVLGILVAAALVFLLFITLNGMIATQYPSDTQTGLPSINTVTS